MSSIAIIFVLSVLLTVGVALPLNEGRECLLRNNAIGICKSIKKCQRILNFGTPSSQNLCDENNKEIVCCPRDSPPPDDDDDDSIVFSDWRRPTQFYRPKPTNPKIDTRPISRPITRTPISRPITRTPISRPITRPAGNPFTRPITPTRPASLIAKEECDRYNRQKPLNMGTKIIDGEIVDDGDYPHVAALGYLIDDKIDYDCGGTLISERYIVTAAHCILTKKQVRPSQVRLGTVNLDDGRLDKSEIDYDIKNITIHPDYKRTSRYNDIALIELSRPVQFSETIYPACIYDKDDDPTYALTVAGWGTTNIRVADSQSRILLRADLVSVPRTSCNREYSTEINGAIIYDNTIVDGIKESQICAVDPDSNNKPENRSKDTCQGDSGGPLQMMINGMETLVGVTSFSLSSCGSGLPGVYTKVSQYLDWIVPIVWPDVFITNV